MMWCHKITSDGEKAEEIILYHHTQYLEHFDCSGKLANYFTSRHTETAMNEVKTRSFTTFWCIFQAFVFYSILIQIGFLIHLPSFTASNETNLCLVLAAGVSQPFTLIPKPPLPFILPYTWHHFLYFMTHLQILQNYFFMVGSAI